MGKALHLTEKINTLLCEKSLNRMYHHLTNPNVPCCIISPNKGTGYFYDSGKTQITKKIQDEVNWMNNVDMKELKQDIKKLGYGFFAINGCYREAQSPTADREKSIFIVDHKGDPAKFKKDMIMLGQKYAQECVAFKNPDGVYVWLTTMKHKQGNQIVNVGSETELGRDVLILLDKEIEKMVAGLGEDEGVGYSKLNTKTDKNIQLGTRTTPVGQKDPYNPNRYRETALSQNQR